MTRAQTDSSVAVEILVKEDQFTPMRVALVPLRRAGRRPGRLFLSMFDHGHQRATCQLRGSRFAALAVHRYPQ